MKTIIKLIVVICSLVVNPLFAQLDNWLIAPMKINVQANIVAPGNIIGATSIADTIANGVYDIFNEPVFYISDNAVYDQNNVLLGYIPNAGAEVIVVPFGNNDIGTFPCQNKYNIFTTSGGFSSSAGLYQSVLDLNSHSLITLPAIDNIIVGTEFGSIAVGRVFGVAKDRYLYFLAGSGTLGAASGLINKLVIHNDGTVSTSSTIYPTALVTNTNAGAEVFSRELELSIDGRWLAWASYSKGNVSGLPLQYRYHFIALDANGNLDFTNYGTNAYQQFNVNGANFNLNNNGFRGIEFYKDATTNTTTLYVGAGDDGIYPIEISIPFNFSQIVQKVIATNPNYGYSQIELAKNGKMYASSGVNNMVEAFDPQSLSPSLLGITTAFPFTNPPKATYNLSGNPFSVLYTLPDQLDGQDYSLITPAAVAPVVTYSKLEFPSNGGSGQSATWTYGLNPVNNATSPIHIIHELRIKQNSTVTIKGMTLKFSPESNY
jgi:hypothetical protein